MSDDAGRDARCFVEVVGEGLEVDKYRRLVEDDGAGAIASFVGVTRNTFQGKVTVHAHSSLPQPCRDRLGRSSAHWL